MKKAEIYYLLSQKKEHQDFHRCEENKLGLRGSVTGDVILNNVKYLKKI